MIYSIHGATVYPLLNRPILKTIKVQHSKRGNLIMIYQRICQRRHLLPLRGVAILILFFISTSHNLNHGAPTLIFVASTKVQWEGNKNISPEHEAAHNAPRSQKYWDEHNIKRPDYAKTDAEIRAERMKNGNGSRSGFGLFGRFMIVSVIISLLAIAYANITGDWDTVLNNPVGSFVYDSTKRMAEIVGTKGHKLGTSGTTTTKVNDDEARRMRLARFDNKNMLDNMKSE